MAKARTSRPTPAPTNGQSEADYIADMLVQKVWQGDESRRGIATQAASVALAAIQDYTAARYMETADQFKGRDLQRAWLSQQSLLEEARASVALDKGDGETQSLEGAYTRKPNSTVETIPGSVKHTPTEWSALKGVIVRDPDGWRGDKGRPWTDAITEQEFDQRVAISTVEDAHPDGWRDDL